MHHRGHEHALHLEVALLAQPLVDLVEEHPLVQRVLIDEHHLVVALEHEIRAQQLTDGTQPLERRAGALRHGAGRRRRRVVLVGLRRGRGRRIAAGVGRGSARREREAALAGHRRRTGTGEERALDAVGQTIPHARVSVRVLAFAERHAETGAHLLERGTQRAADHTVRRARIPPAHLRLAGVHVHVDLPRIEGEEDERHRTTSAGRKQVAVGLADGMRHRAVADVTTVEEHLLELGVAARERGRADPRVERRRALGCARMHELARNVVAVHLRDAQPTVGLGRRFEQHLPTLLQAEGHVRERKREPPHQRLDVAELRGRRAQELAASGNAREEVFDPHHGAGGSGGGCHGGDAPLEVLDTPCIVTVAQPRRDARARDAADAGEGFTTEPHARDVPQVLDVADLRRGVRQEDRLEVFGRHAVAVVPHLDQVTPAFAHGDVDAGGSGIERVLDELLHDGGRALHDLACGDLVDDVRIEYADTAHGGTLGPPRDGPGA